jgi:hypothetical protein
MTALNTPIRRGGFGPRGRPRPAARAAQTVAVVSLAQAVRSAAIVAPRTRLLLEVAARAAQRTARRREAQRRGLRRRLIRRSAAVGFVLGAATAGAVRAGGSSPAVRR